MQQAILAYRNAKNAGQEKNFGEILIDLKFVTEKQLKSVLALKEEAKKRFILDYTSVPQPSTAYSNDTQKLEDEVAKLKDENIKLKRKMLQLLELVKKNGQ